MVELSDREVVTPPCRLTFPSVFEVKPTFPGSEKETYQAVVLIPPDVDKQPFVRAIKAAMLEKFGEIIKLSGNGIPLRKCEDKAERPDGYDDGWYVINANANPGHAPGIVDQKCQKVIDKELIYAGLWCHFHLQAFAWDHKTGGKGVSFSFCALQIAHDDVRLSGATPVTDVFEPIAVDDDDGDRKRDADMDDIFGG